MALCARVRRTAVAEAREPLVVVVAYHGADDLRRALAPLRGLDVLVVDNSSSSDVVAAVLASGATYCDAGGNLGFARAVNLGLARATGRDVVLVNPDAVMDAATVRKLKDALHAGPLVAAAAPALVGSDGVAQRVRWPYPTPGGAWLQALGLGRLVSDHDGFLVGAVLALRAEAIARVGGFDPDFFLYSEETDWQRRASGAGFSVTWAQELLATHVGGATSTDESRREVHFHAGAERYIRKWHGRRGWWSYRAAYLLGGVVRSAVLRGPAAQVARRRTALFWSGPMVVEKSLARR